MLDFYNSKLNPHMTPGQGIEPGPHWWEASAVTTALSPAPHEKSFKVCVMFAFLKQIKKQKKQNKTKQTKKTKTLLPHEQNRADTIIYFSQGEPLYKSLRANFDGHDVTSPYDGVPRPMVHVKYSKCLNSRAR